MPKDKDFKRLVRQRMAETGAPYTKARAELRLPPPAAADWKERHIENADRMLLAVWRAFAAPDGEPLDIRQRFFVDPLDEEDARCREERLRTEVLRHLDDQRREPFMTNRPPQPDGVPGMEIHFNEGFRGRRSGYMGGGGADDVPRLPVRVLAARALTQLTGEAHEPLSLVARYRAVVRDDGTLATSLDVFDESVPVADIRFAFAEKLRAHPVHPGGTESIEVGVYPDGHLSHIMMMNRRAGEPVLPTADLISAALADLTD